MTLTTYYLIPGPSILVEDDRKILTISSIILYHTQALNHPAMILNEFSGYCSIASRLVMVDMEASCVEHVLNYRMIEIRGDVRTVDFCNRIVNNKLLEL